MLKPAFRKLVNLKSDRFENKIFVDSGSMYMVKIKEFKKLKTFYTNKIGGYFMSQNKSIDIDYISDYQRLIKNTLWVSISY